MTDGNDERGLIAAARRGLSPTAADRERVRRATLAALAPVASLPSGHTGGAAPIRNASWAARLASVGLVAVTAGSVGYLAGLRAGQRQANLEAAVTIPSPVAGAPALSKAAAPAAGEPNGGRAPLPLGSVMPAADGRTSRPALRRRATAADANTPEIPADSSASLATELQALRAVERALREGNPRFALSLLRELDRTVPNGRLREERLATLTIARCTAGDIPLGVDMAEDFADAYPDSVYGRRVFDACAATDSSHPGDSASKR